MVDNLSHHQTWLPPLQKNAKIIKKKIKVPIATKL
jgi:hypothetical protein